MSFIIRDWDYVSNPIAISREFIHQTRSNSLPITFGPHTHLVQIIDGCVFLRRKNCFRLSAHLSSSRSNRPFVIGTGAYDVALGVLFLMADTLLHPILLWVLLIKLITAEKIYTILDKELLATEATYESW